MMKKKYITPEMEQIKIDEMSLLTGSISSEGIETPPGYGGVDDGDIDPE